MAAMHRSHWPAAMMSPLAAGTLLAIVFLLLGTTQPAGAKYANSCTRIASCSCNYIEGDLEYDCPPVNSLLSVKVKPSERVRVDCHSPADSVYEMLPAMQLDNILSARFDKCPTPPGGTPYQSVIGRLGLRRIRTLILSNGASSLVRDHFSGLSELERLTIQKNRLSDLPADLFADLGNLTWLDLRSNELHLTVDTFRDLHQLEFLELGYNSLQSLKPGVFRNQRRLRHLTLWGNNLRNLSAAEMMGLTAVDNLDLSGNDLESLEPGVFDGMTSLANLHLSLNPLRVLPAGLLTHTNLSQFIMVNKEAGMTEVPGALFANLSSLDVVVLSTGLETVPEDMFVGSLNVQNITLSDNRLSVLPARLFEGLKRLLELDVSGNRLVQLEDGVFDSLESLVILRLNNNDLEVISDDTFAGMPSLLELHLGSNHLRTIGQNAFRNNKHLHNLQIPDNHLTFISVLDDMPLIFANGNSPFSNLPELRTLNLRNNSLNTILSDWNLFNRHLEQLDLSYNRIQSLGVNDLQSLSYDGTTVVMNLTHNAIREIDFSLLDHHEPRNLTIDVHLEHNPLTCDCTLISFVQYLHHRGARDPAPYALHLHVGEMRCAAPPKMEGRLVFDVRELELLCPLSKGHKACPFACDCDARPVDRTLIVNCSNAGLTQLPSDLPIPGQYKLNFTELHVQNNHIKKLLTTSKHNVTGYDFVTELHASNNNLTELHVNNLPQNLRLLDVRHNRLSLLNETVLQRFNQSHHLRHIALAHNPWRCDCEARDLLLFAQSHPQRLTDLPNVECAQDARKLYKLRLDDICPVDPTLVVLFSVTGMLLGLTAGGLFAFYYKYKQEVKVWLFSHNMLACMVTELEVDVDKRFDAFVSYSHKDQAFVDECLVRELEKGAQPYRLCIHERDFLVGGSIAQSIADSVESSRRTIIVLTKNFVESDWGKMEFRVAHKKALSENRARVIVIVCGELQDMKLDSLDAEMRAYLQTNTYIKWGDPWFWKKLRYAMPHLQPLAAAGGAEKHQYAGHHQHQHHHHHHTNTTDMLQRMKSLKGCAVDDKLDLIKPLEPATPPMTTPPAELAGQKFVNSLNGHVNGAFIINTSAKQSDV